MNTQIMPPKMIVTQSRSKLKIFKLVPVFLIFSVSFLLSGTNQRAYGVNQNFNSSKLSLKLKTDDEFLKEYQEARDLIAREEWSKAAEKFNKIIQEYPKHSETDAILYWLAFSYKKQNKFEEADKALERLTQEFPSSLWARDAKVMSIEILPRLRKEQTTLITTVPTRRKSESLQIITSPGGQTEVIRELSLDADSEIRLEALKSLLMSDEKAALEAAGKILRLESESERLRQNVMFLIARHGGAQAVPLIIETVHQKTNPELRSTAISVLGGMTYDAAGDFLLGLYETETLLKDKRQALFALSRHKRGVGKIMEIAKSGDNLEFRKIAVFRLGRIGGQPAVEFLLQLYDSESNQEIKSEALSSLGNTRNKQAIKKLIDVARRDQSPQMKKNAIIALGGSNDPEAIMFLQEIAN